jgi:hypothetical protein
MNPLMTSPEVHQYAALRMDQLKMVLEYIPSTHMFKAFDPNPYAELTDQLKQIYPNTVLVRMRMVLSGEDLPMEERRYLELPRVRQVEAFWLVDPETLDEPAHGFIEIGMLREPHIRGVYQFSATRHYQGLKGGELHLAQYPIDEHPPMPEFELCLSELILRPVHGAVAGHMLDDTLDGALTRREWLDVLALPAGSYAHAAKPGPGVSD